MKDSIAAPWWRTRRAALLALLEEANRIFSDLPKEA